MNHDDFKSELAAAHKEIAAWVNDTWPEATGQQFFAKANGMLRVACDLLVTLTNVDATILLLESIIADLKTVKRDEENSGKEEQVQRDRS